MVIRVLDKEKGKGKGKGKKGDKGKSKEKDKQGARAHEGKRMRTQTKMINASAAGRMDTENVNCPKRTRDQESGQEGLADDAFRW